MATKRQQIEKGKGVATSSGHEELDRGKIKKRTQEQIERDSQLAWEVSIRNRGVKAERHIKEEGWPLHYAPVFQQIRAQGMDYWFSDCLGYNTELVEDFFRNMVLPEAGTFLEPNARVVSRVAGVEVYLDATEIARTWGYERPIGPFTYPVSEDEFDQHEVVGCLYDKRSDAHDPHKPGKFKELYRFINQVVCFNLYPQGREAEPTIKVGNLLVTFMDNATVCDWALFAFGLICDFRGANQNLRLPFPCLITKSIRERYSIPRRMQTKNDKRSPGDFDHSFVGRSKGQSKASESVLAPPPSNAGMRTWFKKIFGLMSCIAKSNQKIKREGRERDRRLQNIEDRLAYEERRRLGDSSAGPSFRPRDWPPLEVSDDFGVGSEQEEEDVDEAES